MNDDKAPDTVEVLSEDIIRSGPVERGVNAVGQDDANQRAEHWKNACAEADRRVKELEVMARRWEERAQRVNGEHAIAMQRLDEIRHLAIAADNELAHAQRIIGEQCYTMPSPLGKAALYINNARAALTKAKETL